VRGVIRAAAEAKENPVNVKPMLRTGVLFAALAAVAVPAQAATTGTMSGTACQSLYDPSYQNGRLLWHDGNAIRNSDVYTKYVSCPIPRVNGTSTTGLSAAYVDLSDASAGTMSCSLNSWDDFGNLIASSGTKYSGGTGQREIAFGNFPTSVAWGTYTLSCTLPPLSATQSTYIYSYQWVER
jgi:hypothetical protein